MLADINGNLADLRSEAMASQRFCLRWNNHQSNLLSVFDQLLHDEAFVDVTLAVEGQLLRAHKMVLSACSPYFQALFVGHPDRHPIVILKDVPYVDMRSLLDFMYRGEVSVDQDRLTAFLRVAESLRIKGLTEVNEDKCDLPSITSSLLSNQNTVPQPPPNLHRINQIGSHHHISQKRFHHMSSHPLLGSALTAPKRKRGRPRKLSGSSDTPLDSMGQDHHSSADLVQGSPEMMEVKMGIDFQSDVAASGGASNGSSNNSGGGGGGAASSTPASAANLSAALSRQDEPTENGTDITDSGTKRVKREPEPTPSTSAQATEETFARPHSRQGSDGFKQELTSSQSSNLGTSPSSQSSPESVKSPITPSTPTANNNAPSTSSSTSTTNTSSTRMSSSPASGRANTPNSPAQNAQSPGAMSAPQGRQVPKRRMRRRATSQSQDPAEQLTEMSVRGLNLFRYASISEGVYQCTECAKLDIQKTFKNKYSFQRHAFLYHEGHQRKVFPCPICGKEFSRPDKMKNHMKTVHDCFMPKDCVMPFGLFLPP
ncbi:protein tramtrack, alpha isoform-like isoform X1 [Belonocnema kinseyi]|uniref:protein tramtrack, alpha isoform-like isoform X1 n=1 Tax=Belonocnema kinseyi TaxID=2817044 RepID=UPI00143CE0E3|nr:protein tramtrack, alpha isoform-like isoform X1 [Belonocnema kinseyi]XP_033227176.1 protein tramtrack, alpha isoform-like isoform X1 [Belonocnema kinseyi]XP_033227178.1 protein tramtrack, alpha isoform-like isoform X1 [Belonocnema kinseyi]XP_033227179.1 protein tramtrack, alpha isoform-like isoform X1 [Belonocnema kinseyi]XP_033227180.1 protein tramtrack, alpha isoform-like isoform X1 [Belonocnema kinseyi]